MPDECETDSDSDGVIDACDPCPRRKPGDVSGGGLVDMDDVGPFVMVLLDPGSASPDDLCAADVNGSGLVNGQDIQDFVNVVMGG